jgi:glycine dehydrogenase subunit 1
MPFIPHTEDDTAAMLAEIGVEQLTDLFAEIPEHLRNTSLDQLPTGLNEMGLLQHAHALAAQNHTDICFAGAGSYQHHIPAAVWDIASRGEFLTAYTPYQAEASQGTLQLVYEYQTFITELTAMDVANASLYDGASALAEAALMSVRLSRDKPSPYRILVPRTLHPFYRETLRTLVSLQGIELIDIPFDVSRGVITLEQLNALSPLNPTALIIAQPNFFGCLEDVNALTDWAHAQGALCIGCVNPISLGLLNPPGDWGQTGADIVCGEGQPLGAPMSAGGPYFGFFSTRLEFVRQMPGRLVGCTVDSSGKRGFTLTLQAREQHIRRGKATSNICTNQGLLVTAATIHMSLLGPQGLAAVAHACHQNTQALVAALTALPGVSLVFQTPYFHEALLQFNQPVEPILAALRTQGILGGVAVEANTLLVCATEMRTPEDIALFAQTLATILAAGETDAHF